MGRGRILTIAGFVLLAGIAVAGWVRTPEPAAVSAMPAITCYDQMGRPVTLPVMWNAPYGQPGLTPASASAYPQEQPQRTVVRERQYTPTRVVRKRPVKHSAAIVAASAGTGAAIGALAGGGRGAAIGALSGGAAGFIYDRLTHKKTEYR